MRERLLAKGVAPERVTVIPDWADCAAIRPLRHNRLRDSFGGKFVVMYSGNLGLSQQLETVLGSGRKVARRSTHTVRADRRGRPQSLADA